MTPLPRLEMLRLRVRDLQAAVEFYTRKLGFHVAASRPEHAHLSFTPDSRPILELADDPAAEPSSPERAGLFHAAVLLPGRSELANWVRHAANAGAEFDGFADHGVSEAAYLTDPEGNGLEFYRDRPRAQWPFRGDRLAMTTLPLDVRRLLADASAKHEHPLAGACWGHLHLSVTDLTRSHDFYQRELGLTCTQDDYPGARFLAAGGYHHHVAINVWRRARLPWRKGGAGLAGVVFSYGETPGRELQDPDGIPLLVRG
jgi:catechol 2,3-dioxygenase